MNAGIGVAIVVASLAASNAPTNAAPLPRIASINLCTDQLLVPLADPAQIVGLSPYAGDAGQSWIAARATPFRKLSGGAEDLLVLRPDVVVASAFDKSETRALLEQQHIRVVAFTVPRSLAEARNQILQMGDLTGHPDRASTEIARLDAAIRRAHTAAETPRLRVLPVSRRGWVTGSASLLSSLLDEAGVANAASELGIDFGNYASLETIIAAKADALLVSSDSDVANDDGEAFLLHPALARFYPRKKQIMIPEPLTVCGGVMLADALDRLTDELRRIDTSSQRASDSAR